MWSATRRARPWGHRDRAPGGRRGGPAARNPGEALLIVEREPGEIHLLATDVVMPGMNGHELHRRLLPLRPGLKCLYLSGYTADVIAQRGVLPEGTNFLQKPYSLRALAAKVRAVLDG